MTHAEYAKECVCQRKAAYRLKQIGVDRYDGLEELTDAQLSALNDRFGSDRVKQSEKRSEKVSEKRAVLFRETKAVVPAQNIGVIEPKKNTEERVLFYGPFAVTLLSVTLTVSGLSQFAGAFGFVLGLMFGLFLFGAVFVARNKNKGDTSQSALNTVLYMELGACILHLFTFHEALSKYGGPGPIIWGGSVLCSVFVAVISYNSVTLIRNYSAE